MNISKLEPQGLGGWLILVGMNIAASALFLIWYVIQYVMDPVMLEIMGTPAEHLAVPIIKTLLYVELGFNFLFAMLFVLLNVLFYTRKRIFPKAYSATLIAMLLFHIGYNIVYLQIPELVELAFDADSVRTLVRGAGYVLIWVPYLYLSKRVKNTFVN